jgi:ubiquinone/menaquinone biosynthesis C-methylase UbiE
MSSSPTYVNSVVSDAFQKYSFSPDAQIEHALLQEAISKHLPQDKNQPILDAGCGTGWLAQELFKRDYTVSVCDLSPDFISTIKKNNPQIPAITADLSQKLTYPSNYFASIILNMVGHDLKDLPLSLKNLQAITQPQGKLILTIANPYYSYPVGRWKRGIIGRLLFRKPSLKLLPYTFFQKNERLHLWNKTIPSYFYTLPEYIKSTLEAGYSLENFTEITAKNDSPQFDRQYQLYRFPMILLLVFKKNS